MLQEGSGSSGSRTLTQRSYLPVVLGAPPFHFPEKSLAAEKNRNKTKITVPPNGQQKNKGVLLPSTAPKSFSVLHGLLYDKICQEMQRLWVRCHGPSQPGLAQEDFRIRCKQADGAMTK